MTIPITHRAVSAALILALVPTTCANAQQPTPGPAAQTALPQGSAATSAQTTAPPPPPPHTPTRSNQRRAAKLYIEGAKLFEKEQFEGALQDYMQAAALDTGNPLYAQGVEVARSHLVLALIQQAAKDRMIGNRPAARAAIERAHDLDPQNPQVAVHLAAMGDEEIANFSRAPYRDVSASIGDLQHLDPAPGVHSFHIRNNQRQVLQQVYKAFNIDVSIDESVRNGMVRFDVDDAGFAEATRVLGLLTHTFSVPIDAHRAVVARDSRETRMQFMRNGVETVYLSGMTSTEMTDVGNMARNLFEFQQSAVDASAGTLTLRGPETSLKAFNSTLEDLMGGRAQVLLDVRLIQLAHNNNRNTGVQLPQQITAFNVYAEEQSILNANQDLVQQIISSGLAAPGDTLAILGILLASGQVSSSIFSNGFAIFGGGLTLSGLSPKPVTGFLSLNSSDSRELDDFQLRLQDGEEGTMRNGSRYPIMTSKFSNVGTSATIPGLNSAGNSSALSSILASLGDQSVNVPQIQYQDLGLVLKSTPRVLRSGEVALSMDMKISALAGTSVNDVPVLANRAYSGVVTVKQNEAVVIACEVDKQESRALSGIPGLTEVPGLNDVTEKDTQSNYATLLVIVTPHVLRIPHSQGRSPMVRVEKNATTH